MKIIFALAVLFLSLPALAGEAGVGLGQVVNIAEIALTGLGAIAALFTAIAALSKTPEDDRYASGFQQVVNRLSLLPLGLFRSNSRKK